MEQGRPDGFAHKAMIAAALAAATSFGALAGPTAFSGFHSVMKWAFPDPGKYLEGRYKGHWKWIDGGMPMETNDEVFINVVEGGQLSGHGIDPQYGSYTISGYIRGKEINGTYLSDPRSEQPSAQGAFIVNVKSETPTVVLDGDWYGINQKTRAPISGRVTLTAQLP
jgi:hypothetical protein